VSLRIEAMRSALSVLSLKPLCLLSGKITIGNTDE
jgi:hypothetical protein